MFRLSVNQINKLSDLFMDFAKALFLSGLLIRTIDQTVSNFEIFRAIVGGLFFAFISIKIIEERKTI